MGRASSSWSQTSTENEFVHQSHYGKCFVRNESVAKILSKWGNNRQRERYDEDHRALRIGTLEILAEELQVVLVRLSFLRAVSAEFLAVSVGNTLVRNLFRCVSCLSWLPLNPPTRKPS